MALIDNYLNLLILQYSDKPNAIATIEALVADGISNADLIDTFNEAFDLDTAIGVQLVILGKIIGLSRTVPLVVPKIYFSYEGNPNGKTYNQAPMLDQTQVLFTDLELNDTDYRKFLKAKVSKNFASNTIASNKKISTNDALNFLFDGGAYAKDNFNMSFDVLIENTVDTSLLTYINALDLIPRPAAVNINYVLISAGTFGYSDNANAVTYNQGIMAQNITI